MQDIRSLIISDLEQRIEDEITPSHRQLKVLMVVKVDDWFDRVMVSVFMYTRKKKGNHGKKLNLFVETIVAIGEAFMRHYKLKVDSGQAAKIGAFILYSFEKLGMIEVYLTNAGGKHAQYCVRVTNDDNLAELYTGVVVEKVPKYPSIVPYEPFTTGRHPCGTAMVKTQSSSILKALNPTDHPIVFKTVNRKMSVPWVIDKEVLNIANTCFENQSPAFNSIWTVENPEARESKSRETSITLDMAYKFADVPFYHFYTLDFRGRVYCSTAFLNEQGGDLAKGILRRQEKKRMGVRGFYWLMVSIASNWAGNSGMYGNAKTDKIPLDSRYKWALDNEKDFLNYAHMPFENTGWMDADSPWQFLSNCIELKRFRDWQKVNGVDNYEFPSNLVVYIDGTTNGSQHLTALTRDHTVAPFVNLSKTELPGDLYRYVADNVWHELQVKYDAFDESAPFRLYSATTFVNKMVELKKAYKLGTSESSKTKLLKDMQELRQTVPKLLFDDSYVIFFLRITDLKERRKIVKRNVMTVPYGGSPYGMGQQMKDDARKHGIEFLNYADPQWHYMLGRLVHKVCREYMPRSMKMLKALEAAGAVAEKEGRFLSWKLPITEFPVSQHYVEGRVAKKWVMYGPARGERLSTGHYINEMQISVSLKEDPIMTKGKQAVGAAPNVIHSLDACHLMIMEDMCDFIPTSIHDSFGAHLADMSTLYQNARLAFYKLYEENPLDVLKIDLKLDLEDLEMGEWEPESILSSEFAFS